MLPSKYRFFLVVFILTFLFIGITIRLTFLSFQGYEKHHVLSTTNLVLRGAIFDRYGVTLAANQEVPSIFASPDRFEQDIGQDLDTLAKVLNISKTTLIKKLKLNKKFNWLKRKVPKDLGEQIKSLKMKGISIIKEYKRIYPYSKLASHLLGFTGIDDVGLEGLEYGLNSTLKPKGNLNPGRKVMYGNNIYLTIDSRIQKISENIIRKGVEENMAEGASLIIVDASNGEIMSLANYPDFDGNDFNSYPKTSYKNVVVTNYYEPGSIFKIFSAAIFLEEGKVKQNDRFMCRGKIVVNGRIIKCTGVHGFITLREVLKKSCNVGIVKASLRIHRKDFYKYLKRFEFGKKTGIDLPGEINGLLRPYKELNNLSKAMISFGHEIAVTPLQLIMAAAAIGNNGLLQKPILIKKITNHQGKIIKTFHPVTKNQVLSKSTSKKLLTMLESVLKRGGTGEKARIDGFRLSGKTSTINLYDKTLGRYREDLVNTAFLGFVPQGSKYLVVLIIVRKPKTHKSASRVAVPLFRDLLIKLMNKGLITRQD